VSKLAGNDADRERKLRQLLTEEDNREKVSQPRAVPGNEPAAEAPVEPAPAPPAAVPAKP
jgi:hypothetical protein